VLLRHRPRVRAVAIAVGLGACLLVPWMAYQRFYDPPGNRLAKYHLAGVTEPDPRSVSQTLADVYRELGFAGTVRNKVENVAFMVRDRSLAVFDGFNRENVTLDRRRDFHRVWRIFNVLLLALPLLVWRSLKRRQRPGVSLLIPGYFVFVLVEFGGTIMPATIHHGPYALFLLTSAALLDVILDEKWLRQACLAGHLLWFFALWVVTGARDQVAWSASGVIVTAALLALGLAVAWRSRPS
jgi:hypothetical protein